MGVLKAVLSQPRPSAPWREARAPSWSFSFFLHPLGAANVPGRQAHRLHAASCARFLRLGPTGCMPPAVPLWCKGTFGPAYVPPLKIAFLEF